VTEAYVPHTGWNKVGEPDRKNNQAPVRGVVEQVEPGAEEGVVTVLVRVAGGDERFKRGGRAYLEITRETRITRRDGRKSVPAGPEDLKKGVTLEFVFWDSVETSPVLVSPAVVVVIGPAQ
jgi:hypothetical protein